MKYRHLSHIDTPGYYQFITFRTADSITSFLNKLCHEDMHPAVKQQNIDDYLDESSAGCYLSGDVVTYLNDFFKVSDKQLYILVAFAIMPNHVHLLIKPLMPLSKMMQKIKGISAHEINKLLTKSGKLWDNSYYDKAIRDKAHFDVVYNYIKNNPIKLSENVKCRERFFGIYEENSLQS